MIEYFSIGHGSHSHSAKGILDTSHDELGASESDTHVDMLKHHLSHVEPDVFIGLSLCCGFVFMLLIDHISGGHSHGGPAVSGTILQYIFFNTFLSITL